ncbi:terminase small subunit [Leisingera sp. S132]|uniref:terminase small subunit n=1 Tax=Leisingera sp. S132 TaxID=2867016 RepID=UPI0021A7C65D|nr:terminase small subunit [Leisingera sp. S132]UWQ77617.1 terminase small subunit [Leisingera sp. S132]
MSELLTLESGQVIDLSLYPLPEGIEDETFNREQLARAMAVSVVTITKWIDAGMPVLSMGGNGTSYEFLFSHCYAWRKWREAGEAQERKAKLDSAAQKAMLFINDAEEDDRPALSPKEVREWSEAELIRNKAAEQRGELVRRAQVESVLDHVLISFRNAMMNLPDWLEQEFGLSPLQVDKAQSFCDGILEDTRHNIREAGFSPADVVRLSEGRAEGNG